MPNFDDYIRKSAEEYVGGLEEMGMEPSPQLTRAYAKRAYKSYRQQLDAEHAGNVSSIMKTYTRRMNEIKRSGARLRLWTCPPIAAWFAFLSWFSFSQHQGWTSIIMGVAYAVGALAFLAMLIGGAIFDRPEDIK